MKTALVQTNPVIGDYDRNLARVIEYVRTAEQAGAGLVIFPELTLCGYPPQDLLERKTFLDAHDRCLDQLISQVGETGVVVGALERRSGPGKPLYN